MVFLVGPSVRPPASQPVCPLSEQSITVVGRLAHVASVHTRTVLTCKAIATFHFALSSCASNFGQSSLWKLVGVLSKLQVGDIIQSACWQVSETALRIDD